VDHRAGSTAFANSPANFGKFIAEGTENWAKISKFVSSHAEKFVSYTLVPPSKFSPTMSGIVVWYEN
jgi:hypothetical protein